ncbi:MAG: hypothetical protein JWM36_1148 [Hyphomicrobiales bacterium]|nr:hypothetical protein [Hyphomicrobiales bacterium]
MSITSTLPLASTYNILPKPFPDAANVFEPESLVPEARRFPGFAKNQYSITLGVNAALAVNADKNAEQLVGHGHIVNFDEAAASTFIYQVSRRLYAITGSTQKSSTLARDILKFLNGETVAGARLAIVSGAIDMGSFAKFAEGELEHYPLGQAASLAVVIAAVGATYGAAWELGKIQTGESKREKSGTLDSWIAGVQVSNGAAVGTALLSLAGATIPDVLVSQQAGAIAKFSFGLADVTGGLGDIQYALKYLDGKDQALAYTAAGIKIFGGLLPFLDKVLDRFQRNPTGINKWVRKGGSVVTLAVATALTLMARRFSAR